MRGRVGVLSRLGEDWGLLLSLYMLASHCGLRIFKFWQFALMHTRSASAMKMTAVFCDVIFLFFNLFDENPWVFRGEFVSNKSLN